MKRPPSPHHSAAVRPGDCLSSRVIGCPFEALVHTSNTGSRPGELRLSRAITYRICSLHPLPSVLPLSPPSPSSTTLLPLHLSKCAACTNPDDSQYRTVSSNPSANSATPYSGEPSHQTRRTTSHFISQNDAHPDTILVVFRKTPEPTRRPFRRCHPHPFRVDVREGPAGGENSTGWRIPPH